MVTGAGETRIWGDVGENRDDELVWEFKNCENWIP